MKTGEPFTALEMAGQSWRDRIKVHPAAEMFPMMTREELLELGRDIDKNELRHSIVLWTPEKRKERLRRRKSLSDLYLLDGRNRLQAVALTVEDEAERQEFIEDILASAIVVYGDDDPYAYVVSVNANRRHLTAEKKREIVAELLKSRPERSDNATAKIAGSTNKTVGAVRRKLEATWEIPKLDKTVGADGRARPAHKLPNAPAADAELTPGQRKHRAAREREDNRIAEEYQRREQDSERAADAAVEFLFDALGNRLQEFLDLWGNIDSFYFAMALSHKSEAMIRCHRTLAKANLHHSTGKNSEKEEDDACLNSPSTKSVPDDRPACILTYGCRYSGCQEKGHCLAHAVAHIDENKAVLGADNL